LVPVLLGLCYSVTVTEHTGSEISFKVKGAVFDVDDTLLDNKPGNPGHGLHERARLAAAHEAGQRHNIDALKDLSVEDNLDAFMSAPVHTLEAAVWNILVMTGQADSAVMNRDNVLHQEIVARKDELYEDILRNEGEEVPGAARFVRALAASGIEDKMAIASTAIRRDVDIFLGKTGLISLFPEARIKTKESITHPKPNPEVFNLAFESLSLLETDRSYVCAFEDDPRGIMAARAAGLYVCAIGTRYSVERMMALEVPPHVAFATYDEFMNWFKLA
jgi:beta-phosphoglucomutase-like phosphatase (HAD superfamily)